jgi:hypothetical protein
MHPLILPVGSRAGRSTYAADTRLTSRHDASGTIPAENGRLSEILGELGWNIYLAKS